MSFFILLKEKFQVDLITRQNFYPYNDSINMPYSLSNSLTYVTMDYPDYFLKDKSDLTAVATKF
jgi:hypothetical protein